MKICQKCLKEFTPTPIIDGKRKILYNRKFCYDCSPFGKHNTSKFAVCRFRSAIDKLSNDEFKTLIESSTSRNDVFIKLGVNRSGYSTRILNRRLERDNIDVSHFVLGGELNNKKIKSENVYIEKSFYRNIRNRFFNDKLKEYKCEVCDLSPMWNNAPLNLQLDHVNGNRYDNQVNNLRWICPNCHTQTKTFAGQNCYYKFESK